MALDIGDKVQLGIRNYSGEVERLKGGAMNLFTIVYPRALNPDNHSIVSATRIPVGIGSAASVV